MEKTTSALLGEYVFYGVMVLLIINTVNLGRAWRNLHDIIQRTATLHNFEAIDRESGISIIGLAHKLFFMCPCGFQVELKGRRQKCPKCRNRLDFTPGFRHLVRNMAAGIGTLTIPEIDRLISKS
ncbi:MAG: hypothetical protein HW405_282 [Candidatus Berkelbacteria bacterium]|nr:hypothetical protein [Candidatus Berkelbacteria bacterium]